MKLLFYNCVYRPGHMYYDTKMITFLSKTADKLIVLQPKSWFDIDTSNVQYVDCQVRQNQKAKLKRVSIWLRSIYNSLCAIKEIRKNTPDIVVIGEYELSTFGITFPLLNAVCRKIIIIHHNNIDQLTLGGIKAKLFNKYKDDVYHCTLEPYIKEFIQDRFRLKVGKVFCWPHPAEPINQNKDITHVFVKDFKTPQKLDLIGLSQSNDERFIEFLIKKEIESQDFKKNNLHVVLKSKVNSFDDGYLTVIKGWIDSENYDKYYKNTRCVLVAFPSSYRYRVSATLIEAIRDGIQVIGSNIELMRYYNKEYPHICQIYMDDSFISDLLKMHNEKSSYQEEEFKRFLSRHSDNFITKAIEKDLLSIL